MSTDPNAATGAAQALADLLGLGDLSRLQEAVCNYDSRGWFDAICFQNVGQFQLDIVGFLAILGEGSVLATSQVATLSKITLVPRLIPAPQALMKPSRPATLNSAKGFVTGVESGNHRDYVNHVGNVLLDAESLPAYSVRCVKIKRKLEIKPKWWERIILGKKATAAREVRAKTFGSLWWVSLFGFALSATLFALAIWQQDSFAVISVCTLSILSTFVGFSNKWNLVLTKINPNKDPDLPKGDVVIRYPKGNFLIVECEDDVARELYFAPEAIEYTIEDNWKYRLISLVGTMLLMVGVVTLGNSTTWLQIGFAISYVMLNAMYWIVAALPAKSHWDFSGFEVEDQCFSDCPEVDIKPLSQTPRKKTIWGARHPHMSNHSPNAKKHKRFVSFNPKMTYALFRTIVATKDLDWLEANQAMPKGEGWEKWLDDAKKQADTVGISYKRLANGQMIKVFDMPQWDPHVALIQHIKEAERKKKDLKRKLREMNGVVNEKKGEHV